MRRNTSNYIIDALSWLVMLSLALTGLIVRYVLPPGSGGHGGGGGLTLLGGNRHDWGGVHFYLAVAAGVLLLIHIALHWNWVCTTTLRAVSFGSNRTATMSSRARNGWGVVSIALVALILGGGMWLADRAVVDHGGGREHDDHGFAHESDRHATADEKCDDSDHQKRAEHSGEGRGRSQGEGRGEGRRVSDEHHEEHSIRGSHTLADIEAMTGIPADKIADALGLPSNAPLDERLGRLRREYGFSMSDVREVVEELAKENETRQ